MSFLDLHSCVTGSENYSYSMCDYVGEDRRPLVWHLGIAFLVIGVVAFGLRCLARLRTHSWGLDDVSVSDLVSSLLLTKHPQWTILIVVLIYIPMSALTFPLSSHGLGLDMWTLSPDDINQVLYVSPQPSSNSHNIPTRRDPW